MNPLTGEIALPLYNSSRVVLLDPATLTETGNFTVPAQPISTEWLAGDDSWVVASQGNGSLTWLGPNISGSQHSVPAASDPIATADDPTLHLLFSLSYSFGRIGGVSCCGVLEARNDSTGALVYTLNLTGGEPFYAGTVASGAVLYDPLDGLVYAETVVWYQPDLSPPLGVYLTAIYPGNGSIRVNQQIGGEPYPFTPPSSLGLALDPNSGDLIVSSPDGRADLAFLAPLTFQDLGNVSTGPGPGTPVVVPGDSVVLVPNSLSDTVSVINVSTRVVEATLQVGFSPSGMVYDPVDGYVFLSDDLSDSVSILRLQSALSISSFTAHPERIWIANATVLSINASGGDPPDRFQFAGLPPGCLVPNATQWVCLPSLGGNFTIYASVADLFGHTANGATHLEVEVPTRLSSAPARPPSPDSVRAFLVDGPAFSALTIAVATTAALLARRRRGPPVD